jgi:hypothetical protein
MRTQAFRKPWLIIILVIAAAITLFASYALTRGFRGGGPAVISGGSGTDRYVIVQCPYVHWSGRYVKEIDLSRAPRINPHTNTYCPVLDDSN